METKNTVSAFFEKLPFAPFYKKLSAKVPFLAKFDAYANQIVSGVIVLVVVLLVANAGGGSNVKAVQKELAKINTEDSRYWSDFIGENGINAIDYEGDTLLNVAIEANNFDLVKACVKSGADVNRFSKEKGIMPVAYAALQNNYEITKYLINNGADVTLKNSDGINAVIAAFNATYSQWNGFLGLNTTIEPEIMKLLLDSAGKKVSLDFTKEDNELAAVLPSYLIYLDLDGEDAGEKYAEIYKKYGYKPSNRIVETILQNCLSGEIGERKKAEKRLKDLLKDKYYLQWLKENTTLKPVNSAMLQDYSDDELLDFDFEIYDFLSKNGVAQEEGSEYWAGSGLKRDFIYGDMSALKKIYPRLSKETKASLDVADMFVKIMIENRSHLLDFYEVCKSEIDLSDKEVSVAHILDWVSPYGTKEWDNDKFEQFKELYPVLSKAQNIEQLKSHLAKEFGKTVFDYFHDSENDYLKESDMPRYEFAQEKLRYLLDNGIISEEMLVEYIQEAARSWYSDYSVEKAKANLEKFMQI